MQIHVELKRADALNVAEREAWLGIQSGSNRLASPYFALDFLDAIASVRNDTHVIVVREAGQAVAFLPLQLGRFGHARGLGGPLGDHHGLIASEPDRFDLQELLQKAGVEVFDFHGLVGAPFSKGITVSERDGSWVVDLRGGLEAYKSRQKKQGGNTFRTIFSARRKLLETKARLDFIFDDRSSDALAQLVSWKSDQYKASGHFDVFSASWTRPLLETLKASGGKGGARGVVSTLRVDGQLVAAHFGLLGDRAMHYWFPGYDPAFAKAAPGNVLLEYILEALADRGVEELHLGPGDYRYKAALGCWQFPLGVGFAATSGPAALLRRAASVLEQGAEALPLGVVSRIPGKAFRRIDRMTAFRAAS